MGWISKYRKYVQHGYLCRDCGWTTTRGHYDMEDHISHRHSGRDPWDHVGTIICNKCHYGENTYHPENNMRIHIQHHSSCSDDSDDDSDDYDDDSVDIDDPDTYPIAPRPDY